MELLIDDTPCDLLAVPALPGLDLLRYASPAACREVRSLRLALPASATNDALFRFAGDPHAAERFDAAPHRAEVREAGALLLAGSVRLLASTPTGYEVELREEAPGWADGAARRRLDELPVPFVGQLTPTAVVAGWSDRSPVKFFPVLRDEYPRRNDAHDLLPALRLLPVDDCHPFLHVATLLETLFAESGYRVESRFLRSPFFRSLHMSGAYASHDTSAAVARMGFSARRLTAASAAADSSGRVYADPAALYASVGNIVESASPQAVDADGEPVEGLYNHGGCFTLSDGRIGYRPPVAVSAAFDYRLRYTTDHRILSRTRLRGFDALYLGPGARLEFRLANRYEDRRAALAPSTRYRALVFDHAEGTRYRLTCTADGRPGALLGEFAARSAAVTSPVGASPSAPVLEYRTAEGWRPYDGDWALYDGYVEERGRTTVELAVRTPSRRLSPDATVRFDELFFYGAEEGMTLTLHKECALAVSFSDRPGFGSTLRFADVARLGIRQIDLAEGLAHLFNLRFVTDAASRTLYVEPADDLGEGLEEVDWSGRTDFSQPIVRRVRAAELHERHTWRYRPATGATARLEREEGVPYGSWSLPTASSAALRGEREEANPLFAASLPVAGGYADAPSALLTTLGDRDDPTGAPAAPVLVRYAGMHPLPAGERWGYPAPEGAYPLAVFHFAGSDSAEGFTLSFSDRDGIPGLRRYHERTHREASLRERIELSLRLSPDEFGMLREPGSGKVDPRARFRIDTGAGVVRARLCGVGSYDPAAPSVRCTFDRLTED